jgi:hypothetical protein
MWTQIGDAILQRFFLYHLGSGAVSAQSERPASREDGGWSFCDLWEESRIAILHVDFDSCRVQNLALHFHQHRGDWDPPSCCHVRGVRLVSTDEFQVLGLWVEIGILKKITTVLQIDAT